AIFFDLDDTLCGYWDACKAGLRATFDHIPIAGWTTEEMVGHWAEEFREFCPTIKQLGWYDDYLQQGEPTRTELMRRMLHRIDVVDEPLARRLSEAYGTNRNQALKLFPGAEHTLEVLREHYPLGLITNGPADIQRQEIATLGIGHYFQSILIEGEMGEGKPRMSVFRRAEVEVGCEPHQILFLGNSYHHDIKPAIQAGWRTVWIRRASDVPPSTQGVNPAPEERPAKDPAPDAEIIDVPELVKLLGKDTASDTDVFEGYRYGEA
ncbi:MAG TPA: HAD family hydrolase, partial [Fimbriimonas sp.]